MNTLQGMSDADLAALCDCKHDRASHWNGTGQCGWCPCAAYAPAEIPAQPGAITAADVLALIHEMRAQLAPSANKGGR